MKMGRMQQILTNSSFPNYLFQQLTHDILSTGYQSEINQIQIEIPQIEIFISFNRVIKLEL